MAQPPNPETIAALKKRVDVMHTRVDQLAMLLTGLLERENKQPTVFPAEIPPRLAALMKEINLAIGLVPGTLERRVDEALASPAA